VNPRGYKGRAGHAKTGLAGPGTACSVFSWGRVAPRWQGRYEPPVGALQVMSLAFALMAAINGSTGSRATLTYGLYGTKPRRRQSGGGKILTAPRRRLKPPESLTCK
jgi:hypothetical protein